VTSAQFMLDSESRLREAVRKLTSPQATPVPPAPAGAVVAPAGREALDDLFK